MHRPSGTDTWNALVGSPHKSATKPSRALRCLLPNAQPLSQTIVPAVAYWQDSVTCTFPTKASVRFKKASKQGILLRKPVGLQQPSIANSDQF